MKEPAFDLFCRVVDNLGDAGVCWRLATQLAALGHVTRLWIDDPGALARIVPGLDTASPHQRVQGVDVLPWTAAESATAPCGGVVIEAFACVLPEGYLATLPGRHCLWINLEYLSAELWIDGCHGLPSPQPNGVPKYFYFPGFSNATGGLLREPGLFDRRDAALATSRRRRLLDLTGQDFGEFAEEARTALLFCYPHAPLAGLRQALAGDGRPTLLLVPGVVPSGLDDLKNLRVRPIPFVSQSRFDELLWCSDLNIVRGEDSLIRALWAGSPLLWHIYRQADDAHLRKLEAWLARAALPPPAAQAIRAWNGQDDAAFAAALPNALDATILKNWADRMQAWSASLAKQDSLVQGLLSFCMQHHETR